jgi:hypothetical protein
MNACNLNDDCTAVTGDPDFEHFAVESGASRHYHLHALAKRMNQTNLNFQKIFGPFHPFYK